MHQKKYIMGVFDVHLSIVTVYIAKLDLEGMRIVCIASSRACGAEVVRMCNCKIHVFLPRPRLRGRKIIHSTSTTWLARFQLPDIDPTAGKVRANGRRAFEELAVAIAIVRRMEEKEEKSDWSAG